MLDLLEDAFIPFRFFYGNGNGCSSEKFQNDPLVNMFHPDRDFNLTPFQLFGLEWKQW